MTTKKIIKLKNGRYYWILMSGEEEPVLAMYHTAVNGAGFFWRMEMKAVMTCASIDDDFEILKEAEF